MKIVTYSQSRDLMGRFVPSKRKVFKVVFGLVVLGSFVLNYWSMKELYNFKCAEGGGYFMRKVECNDIAEAKFDAREYSRLQLKEAMAQESNEYEQ